MRAGSRPQSHSRTSAPGVSSHSAAEAVSANRPSSTASGAKFSASLAPALKNALDWLSREPNLAPLNGKAACLLGAGGGMGSSRSQYHLRQVCVYLNLCLLNKPEVFSNAFGPAFADNGDVQEPGLTKQVADLMQALADRTRQLRA